MRIHDGIERGIIRMIIVDALKKAPKKKSMVDTLSEVAEKFFDAWEIEICGGTLYMEAVLNGKKFNITVTSALEVEVSKQY